MRDAQIQLSIIGKLKEDSKSEYTDLNEFLNLKEECILLNEYITETRYPGDLPFESIGEDDAREAIEAADKIEGLVSDRIDISFKN